SDKPKPRLEDEDFEPLIDESDEALAEFDDGLPQLVTDSEYFDDASPSGKSFRPQRPGAVIAFDDDDATPAPAPPKKSARAAYDAQRIPRPRGPKKAAQKTRRDQPSGGKST